MAKPASVFDDSYSALEKLCGECPRENGWLEDHENHDTPPCVLAIYENADMMEWDGSEWKCNERKQLEQAEQTLYERRMAGDWT